VKPNIASKKEEKILCCSVGYFALGAGVLLEFWIVPVPQSCPLLLQKTTTTKTELPLPRIP